MSTTQLMDLQTPVVAAVTFDVSIVIVSFNTREVLRQCLQSAIDDAQNISSEIIVVDNASSDGSAEMVERDFPQVRVVRSAINLGFGGANNAALREARGRYFVLLNSDAFFAPGALALAIRHMDETPECGLGGCLLIGRDGQTQPSSRCFHTVLGDAIVLSGLAARFPRSKFFGRFDRTWADQRLPAMVDWVPGAFTILRPSALQRVGLFDPAFFLYYEEVDLCRRFTQAGIPVWYWPDIAGHPHRRRILAPAQRARILLTLRAGGSMAHAQYAALLPQASRMARPSRQVDGAVALPRHHPAQPLGRNAASPRACPPSSHHA